MLKFWRNILGVVPASLKLGMRLYLSGTKIASQNRNDHNGRKRAHNHSVG